MARQVAVPTSVASADLLDRVDYADALTAASTARRTPEQWGRLAMEGAHPALRVVVRGAHRLLLLRLAPTGSPDHIWGWTVLERDPERFVLGVEGPLLTPRLVVTTVSGEVTVSTLIRFDHPVATAVWAVVSPVHRAVARHLVDGAVDLAAASRP
jgi:hypothetical protein